MDYDPGYLVSAPTSEPNMLMIIVLICLVVYILSGSEENTDE